MRKNAAGSPPGTLGSLTLCPRIDSRDLPQIKFRSSAGNGLLQRAFSRTSADPGENACRRPGTIHIYMNREITDEVPLEWRAHRYAIGLTWHKAALPRGSPSRNGCSMLAIRIQSVSTKTPMQPVKHGETGLAVSGT